MPVWAPNASPNAGSQDAASSPQPWAAAVPKYSETMEWLYGKARTVSEERERVPYLRKLVGQETLTGSPDYMRRSESGE
jgi:hypothetical protein